MPRTEKVLVLYGSQTGNSEQAAQELCDQAEKKLSNDNVKVDFEHMQLDDFIELHKAQWTRLIVIIVSSYGVGQAPLGGYRFRELCDYWDEHADEKLLEGLQFAMCGLGDSKYSTFFQNPTKINGTLIKMGATRVGDLGKADASASGDQAQGLVIERWMDSIWPHLARVLAKEPLDSTKLETMQQETLVVCRKINPDFVALERKNNGTSSLSSSLVMMISILMSILAVAAYFHNKQ